MRKSDFGTTATALIASWSVAVLLGACGASETDGAPGGGSAGESGSASGSGAQSSGRGGSGAGASSAGDASSGEGGAGNAPGAGGAAGDAGSEPGGRGGSAGSEPIGGAGGDAGSGGTAPECDDPPPGEAGAGGAADVLEPGAACLEWGTLSCSGRNQKQSLFCDSGTWRLVAECSATESCDNSDGGVCADIVPGCIGHEPGFTFCEGDVRKTCGPDRVTVSSYTCCGQCSEGACQPPACRDGKQSPGEECDDGNGVVADGCEPDCKTSRILEVAAGRDHTCALLAGGHVRCWGGNQRGQLGLGNDTAQNEKHPYELAPVALGGRAVALDAGSEHTCALMQGGAVQCWGANDFGQLGLGHPRAIGDGEVPAAAVSTVALGGAALAVSAGGETTCAVMTDATLRCWGRNDHGQLGLGHTRAIGDTEAPSAANAAVPVGEGVRAVAVSDEHVCAVIDSNAVLCWGIALSLGTPEDAGDDEPASDGLNFTFGVTEPYYDVEVGGFRMCALAEGKRDWNCWGYNGDAALGLGHVSPFAYGLYRGDNRPPLQIAMGSQHTCVRLQDLSLRCHSYNDKGQLGLGHTTPMISGVGNMAVNLGTNALGNPFHAVFVAAGHQHTCAVLDSGLLRCWGLNAQGQLGLGFVSSAPTDFVGGAPGEIPGSLPPVLVFTPAQR